MTSGALQDHNFASMMVVQWSTQSRNSFKSIGCRMNDKKRIECLWFGNEGHGKKSNNAYHVVSKPKQYEHNRITGWHYSANWFKVADNTLALARKSDFNNLAKHEFVCRLEGLCNRTTNATNLLTRLTFSFCPHQIISTDWLIGQSIQVL